MGGANSKPIIGYKYYLGVHFIPCLGPVDALTRIEVDKRTLWKGKHSEGRLAVDEPELFGGKSREGGVSGYVDLMSGWSTQGENDYLKGWLGNVMPAFRGVCSMVLRQAYIGNNPYLKPWAFSFQRIFTSDQGAGQWYPEKAAIGSGFRVGNAAIYIALDVSNSMSGVNEATQKQAVIEMLTSIRDQSAEPNDIRIVAWGSSVFASTQVDDASYDDYDDLISWVSTNAYARFTNTDFMAAVSQVETFFLGDTLEALLLLNPNYVDPMFLGDGFGQAWDWGHVGDHGRSGIEVMGGTGAKRRVVLFCTDGTPSVLGSEQDAKDQLDKIAACEVYAFNIVEKNTSFTEVIDNTLADGVPVVSGGDSSALTSAFENAFSDTLDMNPAHILREVLIATDTGGSGDEGEIGPSFTEAADQLYREQFGLSLFWENPRDRGGFKELVERHIGANCFVNRATGQWELKLIRDDYVVDDLPVFDRSNVVSWSNVNWPDTANLPNQITLTYTDRAKDDTASITLTNTARALSGPIINKPADYEGVHRHDLAAQLAARDLRALSNPLVSGTLRATNVPLDVNLGSAILLNNPTLKINNVVARVVELVEGDGRSNEVEIKFVQDNFAFNTEVVVAPPDTTTPTVSNGPEVATVRLVEEAPYYEVMRSLGQTEADAKLLAEPYLGWLNMAAKAPTNDAIDFLATINAGAGYFDQASVSFAPSAELRASLSGRADETKIMVSRSATLAGVAIGSLAQIDEEYVRVDAIDSSCNFFDLPHFFAREKYFEVAAKVTIGRGCLDTVPAAHAFGTSILFWSDNSGSDEIEYFAGEEIDVKLRTRTGQGTLRQSSSPVDRVTFNQRALRPYPVGALKLDGVYGGVLLGGTIEVTWETRNRLSQTTAVFEDHTEAGIAAEAGLTYTLIVDALDDSGARMFELHRQFVGGGLAEISQASLSSKYFKAGHFDGTKYFLSGKYFNTGFFNQPRYFSGLTPSVAKIEVRVETRRDDLTNWQTPRVSAAVFRAPTTLTVEELYLGPTNLSIEEL